MQGELTQKIRKVQKYLLSTNINGCIAGSSMLDANFDEWTEIPDIDVFVYSEQWLTTTVQKLLDNGYTFVQPLDEWKFLRTCDHGIAKDWKVNTMKVTKNGIIVNITYKRYKNKIADVLASFDMSIIMIGVDIRTGVIQDMREGAGMSISDFVDSKIRIPWSKNVAVPNPLRRQDTDRYGVEAWVRQFSRVMKYWNRGYDTRPMARFYIDAIDAVLERGNIFTSEKSEQSYQDFVDTYTPIKQQMIEWLNDKVDD